MSFLHHAQTASGHFHNFMGFDRIFLDEHGSDDTLGRAVWGLGCAVGQRPGKASGRWHIDVPAGLGAGPGDASPRAWAYVISGLAAALARHKEHQGYRQPPGGARRPALRLVRRRSYPGLALV